jgi:hypothetical protein
MVSNKLKTEIYNYKINYRLNADTLICTIAGVCIKENVFMGYLKCKPKVKRLL